MLLLLGGAALYLAASDYARRHPQDVPWTALDLDHPIGLLTATRIAALGRLPDQCRSLLAEVPAGDVPAPPRRSGPSCGYDDGMRLGSGRDARFGGELVTSCPVAAALYLWDRDVLQLAALRHFGSTVTAIDHSGSYSCRRLYGRSEGPFSQHSTADAVDVTGFRLADGTRISVLRDWGGEGTEADFLSDVRDGACKLFATVLSPDYNDAHADHLHLDVADRGRMGWRLCR